jgi:hypothetical protein
MKTLIFQNPEKTLRVEAKVDIFASNAELANAGFDTRFTNMAIVEDEGAVVEGLALTEIEGSWQAVLAFASAAGYSVDVVDLNENDTTNMITWTAIAGTVAGTLTGTAIVGTASNWDPELTVGDTVSVDGFTYTINTVTDDLNAAFIEPIQKTFAGATVYIQS